MQSSAKRRTCDDTMDGRSLMYRRNNKGPSMVPCGTPEMTFVSGEMAPSSTTLWIWLVRKLVIQVLMLSMPLWCSLLNRLQYLIKGLSKVQDSYVHLCFVIPLAEDIVCGYKQLGDRGHSRMEAMLEVGKDVMFLRVWHDMATHNMLQ